MLGFFSLKLFSSPFSYLFHVRGHPYLAYAAFLLLVVADQISASVLVPMPDSSLFRRY